MTIRLDFATGASIGPGKIELLEAVAETGSIRKAAERMKMSFRQAWLLLQAIEAMFGQPLVEASRGGQGGGGSLLTPLGREVVERYRTVEKLAGAASVAELEALEAQARPVARGSRTAATPRLGRKSLKKK